MPKSQPLEYQPAEPAFLRRLKANNLALDGRHNVQIPRARAGVGGVNDRLNMKGEEGEDEPLVVDEDGNVVSREEMEERMGKETKEGEQDTDGGGGGNDETGKGGDEGVEEADVKEKSDQKVSSGFGKKRKVGKVIVDDGDEKDDGGNDEVDGEPVKTLEESTKDLKSVVGKGKEDAKKEEVGKKTKRKKIKLSFDEPE